MATKKDESLAHGVRRGGLQYQLLLGGALVVDLEKRGERVLNYKIV